MTFEPCGGPYAINHVSSQSCILLINPLLIIKNLWIRQSVQCTER